MSMGREICYAQTGYYYDAVVIPRKDINSKALIKRITMWLTFLKAIFAPFVLSLFLEYRFQYLNFQITESTHHKSYYIIDGDVSDANTKHL